MHRVEQLVGGQAAPSMAVLKEIRDHRTNVLAGSIGEMGRHHVRQPVLIRFLHFEAKTAPQKGSGEISFGVTGYNDKRKLPAPDMAFLDGGHHAGICSMYLDRGLLGADSHEFPYLILAFLEDV